MNVFMQNPLAGGLKPKPSSSPHMEVSMKNVDSAFHGVGQKAYPLAQVYFCIFAKFTFQSIVVQYSMEGIFGKM